MQTEWSHQYRCRAIIPEGETPDMVMSACREMCSIVREDGPDDEVFVVVLRRRIGPELWTEDALRGSAQDGALRVSQ